MSTQQSSRQPWGFMAGLMAGCVITLLGVVVHLEPETIIFRAAVGGVVVGFVVSLMVCVSRVFFRSQQEDS